MRVSPRSAKFAWVVLIDVISILSKATDFFKGLLWTLIVADEMFKKQIKDRIIILDPVEMWGLYVSHCDCR